MYILAECPACETPIVHDIVFFRGFGDLDGHAYVRESYTLDTWLENIGKSVMLELMQFQELTYEKIEEVLRERGVRTHLVKIAREKIVAWLKDNDYYEPRIGVLRKA